ncbi:MAG: nuclear transport factor 2 family protein [Pyrinomonadaceae bacterium]
MKTLALLIVIVSVGFLAPWLQPTGAQGAEEAAVRQTLDYYLQGHATGNGEFFKKAFHPEAKLFWIRDGQFSTRTSAEFIAGASGKPAADEAQRKRSIASVDITGNAAIAKIILDYPSGRFTDYMSLLKVDGEWKIVNKTFILEPKARP